MVTRSIHFIIWDRTDIIINRLQRYGSEAFQNASVLSGNDVLQKKLFNDLKAFGDKAIARGRTVKMGNTGRLIPIITDMFKKNIIRMLAFIDHKIKPQ